ncbi:MAG: type IV pilin protein [Chromatiales bacterium]|nr:type IV pilin protein [Chromatiales bacterium]
MQRSHRVDAERALIEYAQALERHYTQYNSYNTPEPKIPDNIVNLARYTLTPSDSTDIGTNTFTLTATAGAAQDGEPCGDLTLDHTGIRLSEKGGQGCWPKNNCIVPTRPPRAGFFMPQPEMRLQPSTTPTQFSGTGNRGRHQTSRTV